MRNAVCASILAAALASATTPAMAQVDNALHDRFQSLSRSSHWRLVDEIAVAFPTYHPQGMARVADAFFVSSVEVRETRASIGALSVGLGWTRSAGVGHLFKFGADGTLIDSITLGEGSAYHPGGIDFDGEALWIPVAEYRPDSSSIVYRVDPDTLEAVEVLRFDDHVGSVVHDPETGRLHGVSWGSRRFYTWQLDDDRMPVDRTAEPIANTSHYIDYQDCQYVGSARMLCGGVNRYVVPGGGIFTLGGLELVDLERSQPIHQVPVPLWASPDLVMTYNPVHCETEAEDFRCYFMPEDDTSTLFVYEVRG